MIDIHVRLPDPECKVKATVKNDLAVIDRRLAQIAQLPTSEALEAERSVLLEARSHIKE